MPSALMEFDAGHNFLQDTQTTFPASQTRATALPLTSAGGDGQATGPAATREKSESEERAAESLPSALDDSFWLKGKPKTAPHKALEGLLIRQHFYLCL